jgi:hypothetical protein
MTPIANANDLIVSANAISNAPKSAATATPGQWPAEEDEEEEEEEEEEDSPDVDAAVEVPAAKRIRAAAAVFSDSE